MHAHAIFLFMHFRFNRSLAHYIRFAALARFAGFALTLL
jgi:hypothetical protein